MSKGDDPTLNVYLLEFPVLVSYILNEYLAYKLRIYFSLTINYKTPKTNY